MRLTCVVPRKPETFALTRVVCLDASNHFTLSVGIWFARASESTDWRTGPSATGSYLLNSGLM